MDLSQYKQAWKNQPEETYKVSAAEIYKMTQKRSTSFVKWIFIIGILEFVILNSLYLFVDMDEANKQYEEAGIKGFVFYMELFAYAVAIYFLIRFYLNYKNISSGESTKKLMSDILKTRKTVKHYVLFNLFLMFIVICVVGTTVMKQQSTKIPEDKVVILMIVTVVIGLIVLTLVWLFYQLLYGILLRKLNRNYKELTKLDKLN